MSPRGTASSTTLVHQPAHHRRGRRLLALLAGTAGCSAASNDGPEASRRRPPSQTTAKGAPPKVTLTEDAVQRIGLQTAAVRHAKVVVAGRAGAAAVVPFSAVVYVADGSSWAYAAVAPNVYVRRADPVAAVEGEHRGAVHGPARRHRGRHRRRARSCSASKARSRGGMRPPAVGDPLDRRHEPEVPVPRRRCRASAMMVFGIATLPDDAGRRLPRVRAAPGGHPDRLPGPVDLRRRAAGHRAAGAGAQRRPGPGRHAVEVGAAAVVDRAALHDRTPTCCTARQLVQERLATVAPTLPTWAAPPVMLAPGVGDRPGHADRHDVARTTRSSRCR